MRAWRRRSPEGDEGIGLILVIGVSIFVFALAATAAGLAVNAINQSRQRSHFEMSLAVAEAGVDRVLGEVQSAYSDLNADYPVPGPISAAEPSPWCPGTAVSFPSSGEGAGGIFSSEDAERAWATTQLQAIAAAGTCIQQEDNGEYVVLKPVSANVKYGKVYALSARPGFSDPNARTRLVKSEYIFMPYRPTHAILADGALSIASSTTVTAAYGVDPALASVHSNATVSGVGNPAVSGPVTSTQPSSFSSGNFASNPGGTVTQTGAQAVPRVDARSFYAQASSADPAAIADWYDLCTDGSVRPYSASGPCTGTSIGTATSTQIRGWSYSPSQRTWTASKNTLSGTYYAQHSNIEAGNGTTAVGRLTLVAEAENASTCGSKRYGNIEWQRYDLVTPAYHNVWMFADADIVTHANYSAGSFGPPVVSGMFIAGDQIDMQTSSAGAVGSVVTANQCPTPLGGGGLITTSEVKNPSIYFDPNSDAPFASVITSALWLDYSG